MQGETEKQRERQDRERGTERQRQREGTLELVMSGTHTHFHKSVYMSEPGPKVHPPSKGGCGDHTRAWEQKAKIRKPLWGSPPQRPRWDTGPVCQHDRMT